MTNNSMYCIGPKTRLGMTQLLILFDATESRSCGQHSYLMLRIDFLCLLGISYLTKMCDQIVALISPEHAEGITWADDNDDYTSTDADIEESDRVFKFEVAKTKEEEENVSVQPGFQVYLPSHHLFIELTMYAGDLSRNLYQTASQGVRDQ